MHLKYDLFEINSLSFLKYLTSIANKRQNRAQWNSKKKYQFLTNNQRMRNECKVINICGRFDMI